MTRCLSVLTVVTVCLASTQMLAHHAISEIYDEQQTVVLEGEVASFLFGDPHSMVHVRVADDAGGVHTWAVEWRGARHLQRQGWTEGTLHAGDQVRMCGNPGRDPGAYRLHLLNVARIPPHTEPETQGGGLCAAARSGLDPSASRRTVSPSRR